MIKEQSIILNGEKITNVRDVSLRMETPGDGRGIYREPTFATTITVIRDASDVPLTTGFQLATNEDGRKNIITATLEFHGDDVKDTYKVEVKKGFISHYSLNNPTTPNAPTTETIVIKGGDIEFSAGGTSSKFSLHEFR